MTSDPNSHWNKPGAARLAVRIEAYWRALGLPNVKCRLEEFPHHERSGWAVRSNLVEALQIPRCDSCGQKVPSKH
jgi:hypothetical protein